MPFATAMSCGNSQPVGLANLDLRGTPFKGVVNPFVLRGNMPTGATSYSHAVQHGADGGLALGGGGPALDDARAAEAHASSCV